MRICVAAQNITGCLSGQFQESERGTPIVFATSKNSIASKTTVVTT